MPTHPQHFTLEKVRALRAYFVQLRNGARGTPDYADLDNAAKLAEQLQSLMEPPKKGAAATPEKE